MKNIYIYYMAILIPLILIVGLITYDFISSTLFVILLMSYALLYRPIVDGLRLVNKGLIGKEDIWKMIKPVKHIEYFNELYLK